MAAYGKQIGDDMSVHTRVVRSSTILAHHRLTLRAEEWIPEAAVARLRKMQQHLRERCEARVNKIEEQIQQILQENDEALLGDSRS